MPTGSPATTSRALSFPVRAMAAMAAVAVAGAAMATLGMVRSQPAPTMSGSDSAAAASVMASQFPEQAGATALVTVTAPEELSGPSEAGVLTALLADLARLPHVASVGAPGTSTGVLIGVDRRAGLVELRYSRPLGSIDPAALGELRGVLARHHDGGLEYSIGGDVARLERPGPRWWWPITAIACLAAMVLAAGSWRRTVAAGAALATSVGLTFAAVVVLGRVVDLQPDAASIAVAIGGAAALLGFFAGPLRTVGRHRGIVAGVIAAVVVLSAVLSAMPSSGATAAAVVVGLGCGVVAGVLGWSVAELLDAAPVRRAWDGAAASSDRLEPRSAVRGAPGAAWRELVGTRPVRVFVVALIPLVLLASLLRHGESVSAATSSSDAARVADGLAAPVHLLIRSHDRVVTDQLTAQLVLILRDQPDAASPRPGIRPPGAVLRVDGPVRAASQPVSLVDLIGVGGPSDSPVVDLVTTLRRTTIPALLAQFDQSRTASIIVGGRTAELVDLRTRTGSRRTVLLVLEGTALLALIVVRGRRPSIALCQIVPALGIALAACGASVELVRLALGHSALVVDDAPGSVPGYLTTALLLSLGLAAWLASCRYAPGRSLRSGAGRPAASRATATTDVVDLRDGQRPMALALLAALGAVETVWGRGPGAAGTAVILLAIGLVVVLDGLVVAPILHPVLQAMVRHGREDLTSTPAGKRPAPADPADTDVIDLRDRRPERAEPVSDVPVPTEPVPDEPVPNEAVPNAPVTNAPVTNLPVSNAPLPNLPVTTVPAEARSRRVRSRDVEPLVIELAHPSGA